MVKKQPPKPSSSSKSKSLSKTTSKTSNHNANKTPKGSQAANHPQAQPTPPTGQDSAHQQKLLNIFQSTFDPVLSSERFSIILQEVKTALFNRDFDKAFGNEEYLEAYAARWSPTRALCYASVLVGIEHYLAECTGAVSSPVEKVGKVAVGDGRLLGDDCDAAKHDDSVGATNSSSSYDDNNNNNNKSDRTAATKLLKVLAIGGAAAEAVAFGSFLSQQNQKGASRPPLLSGDITLLDVAPWASVVENLRAGMTTPPTLSKYASAAAQAANTALVEPGQLQRITFRQHDVLALSKQDLASLVAPQQQPKQQEQQQEPVVVSLLFTLNELFTAGGIGKTTAFLLTLTSVLLGGSLLLVIDSPGSYSETMVGKEAKRYPMLWLLDKVLLGTTAKDDGEAQWEKVESVDSVWFRLGQELSYPIQLEDMRYQMHLYRRAGSVAGG